MVVYEHKTIPISEFLASRPDMIHFYPSKHTIGRTLGRLKDNSLTSTSLVKKGTVRRRREHLNVKTGQPGFQSEVSAKPLLACQLGVGGGAGKCLPHTGIGIK